MKKTLSALTLVLLAPLLWVITTAAPAHACPPGQVPSPDIGGICIPASDPGDPGDSEDGEEGGVGGGGGSGCTFNGEKIPCVTSDGVWFSAHRCYARPESPQPAPEDPVWGGNDPTQGQMWTCGQPNVGGGIWYFYVANGSTPALVDPAELAQEALERMRLARPRLNLAPTERTYVGLETWLWTNPRAWRTLTESAVAGGTTVTVVAAPTRIYWNMGDDKGLNCHSAGRPWTSDLGDDAQTDCGYTYRTTSNGQPDGVFTVTAAVYYQVDWTCSGACLQPAGTLGEVVGIPRATALDVGERQSVVVGGDS